jgi:hypothetical protein
MKKQNKNIFADAIDKKALKKALSNEKDRKIILNILNKVRF